MTCSNELNAISGVELMKMEFPQHQFCIEDILPKGLSVLTSESMDNARSLAMELSLCVAVGQQLWNMESQQGTVLHMVHQDALAVTRNRIILMTKPIPRELYVGMMTEDSLALAISAIPVFVKEHPNVSLIVAELEGMVACVNEKLYAQGQTLQQYNRLKEMAAEYNIAILVTQQSVNSTFGMGAGSDSNMACISDVVDSHFHMCSLLYPANRASLKRTSRTYGSASWNIEYSWKTHRWDERK